MESNIIPKLGFALHTRELWHHFLPVMKHLDPASFDVVSIGERRDKVLIARKAGALGFTAVDSEVLEATGRKYKYLVSNHYLGPVDQGEENYLIHRYGVNHIRFMYAIGNANWQFGEWNNAYDLILCYGADDAARCKAFHKPLVVQMGCPRYDDFYRSTIDRVAELKNLGCDPAMRTVAWLPTWKEVSSIDIYAEAVKKLEPSFQVIVKPHPFTSEREPERIAHLQQLGFTRLITESYDNRFLFGIADIVICDYSGSVFGAMYTDSNLLLLDVPGAEEHPEFGPDSPDIQVREFLVHVRPEEKDNLLAVCEDEALWEAQKLTRAKIRSRYYAPFYGFASEIAATYLRNLDLILFPHLGRERNAGSSGDEI